MCWRVVFEDGRSAGSRDELEAIVGGQVVFADNDMPRNYWDHCLCPVDVPATLIHYDFWVRAAGPDDWKEYGAETGDHIARPV